MGRFHSVADRGHLYFGCIVCDDTIWRHIHQSKFADIICIFFYTHSPYFCKKSSPIHSPYNKFFATYQAQRGFNPKTTPLRTPLSNTLQHKVCQTIKVQKLSWTSFITVVVTTYCKFHRCSKSMHSQGWQKVDKEYSKCLSSLWQIFGKKLTTARLLGILIFRYFTFLQFIFFHAFQIFFWQLNWSSSVKHITSTQWWT